MVARVILAISLCFSAFYYVHSLHGDLEAAELAVAQKNQMIERQEKIIKTERSTVKDLESDRATYLTNLEAANEKVDNFATCIANGTCGVRVKSTCPKLPEQSATADPVRDSGTIAQLTPEAAKDLWEFDRDLAILENRYALCQATNRRYHELID